jgi:MFS family permease
MLTRGIFQAIVSIYFATIIHIVGSGLLAHSIVAAVGGNDKVNWITLVPGINQILFGPTLAQLADFWGRKWFVVGGMLAGAVGCIVVSRADSIAVVLVGQGIAGFNQSCQGLAHTITSEILPRKYRPYAQASIHIGGGIAAAVGLYVGGVMCRHSPFGFRNYWYFTAAIFLVITFIIAFFYNPPVRELQRLTTKEKIRRLDLAGSFLMIVALLGFCIGLGWSQNPYSWKNAHILVPFLTGICGMVGLGVYWTWIRKDGLLHHGLFQGSRNFALCITCITCEGVTFFAANNYFGFEVEFLFGRDLLLAGATYSITWWTYLFSAVAAGYYCSRTKTLRTPTVLSFACFIIYFGLMASVNVSSGPGTWGYGVFLGLGFGVSVNTLVVAAQLSTPASLIASATCLMLACRSAGGSVGLAIYNAVFNGALQDNIGSKIAHAALSHGLPGSSLASLIEAVTSRNQAALGQVPGITPEIISASILALKQAYTIGFRNVYITAAAFSFLGLCGRFFGGHFFCL